MIPAYIYNIQELPSNNDSIIGIVVSLDKKHKQFHCGLSFDIDSCNPRVLHLLNHNCLQIDNDLSGFQCWIRPNIHILLQKQMSILCNVIKNKGQTDIPYGFLYNGMAQYDNNGSLHIDSTLCGLTCATYVLALFNTFGIKLIDIDNWPHRSEDKNWQQQIYDILVRFANYIRITKSHLQHLYHEIGCRRFKPEEVAVSSALYNAGPATYDNIRAKGKLLNQYMWSIQR